MNCPTGFGCYSNTTVEGALGICCPVAGNNALSATHTYTRYAYDLFAALNTSNQLPAQKFSWRRDPKTRKQENYIQKCAQLWKQS